MLYYSALDFLNWMPPNVIQSMTGFASAQMRTATGEWVVELRSVNHRHLELHFKLPDELRAQEPILRERLAAALKRGKVDIAIRRRNEGGGDARAPQVDEEVLDSLFSQCEQHWPDMELGALAHWMRVPGVLKTAPNDELALGHQALECFDAALAELKLARSREGSKIGEILSARLTSLAAVVEQLEQMLPALREAVATRIRTRLAEVGLEADPVRFEQELVLQLQRGDVDEELARLKLHLDELKRLLQSADPVGRRLDFLLQELNREANTLGSKAQDIRSTHAAVDLKVLLEQFREQIQNIE